jgi:hypothetical protein
MGAADQLLSSRAITTTTPASNLDLFIESSFHIDT